MLIKSDSIEASYPIEDMWMFTYEHVDVDLSTSIDAVASEKTSFSYDGGIIVFSGLKANSLLQVYTIGGVLTHSERINSGSYTYPLSDLPAGIYIVNVNGTTFKISKK